MAEKLDYCQYYLNKFDYKALRGPIRATYKTKDEILDDYIRSSCYLEDPDVRNKYLAEDLYLFMRLESKLFCDLDAGAKRVLHRAIDRISSAVTYSDIFGAVSDFMWVEASTRICKKRGPERLISLTDNAVLEYRNAMVWLEEIKDKIDSLKYDLDCMEEVDNLPAHKRIFLGLIEDVDVAWYADWHNISDSERKEKMLYFRDDIKFYERIYFAFLVTNIHSHELRRRYR